MFHAFAPIFFDFTVALAFFDLQYISIQHFIGKSRKKINFGKALFVWQK
jgi:hypothetical protein